MLCHEPPALARVEHLGPELAWLAIEIRVAAGPAVAMPKDLPPHGTCYDYGRILADQRHIQQIKHLLVMADREKAGREAILRGMMASGAFAKLYAKWFESPIPPHSENLNFPMSEALKERVAHPSDSIEF